MGGGRRVGGEFARRVKRRSLRRPRVTRRTDRRRETLARSAAEGTAMVTAARRAAGSRPEELRADARGDALGPNGRKPDGQESNAALLLSVAAGSRSHLTLQAGPRSTARSPRRRDWAGCKAHEAGAAEFSRRLNEHASRRVQRRRWSAIGGASARVARPTPRDRTRWRAAS